MSGRWAYANGFVVSFNRNAIYVDKVISDVTSIIQKSGPIWVDESFYQAYGQNVFNTTIPFNTFALYMNSDGRVKSRVVNFEYFCV